MFVLNKLLNNRKQINSEDICSAPTDAETEITTVEEMSAMTYDEAPTDAECWYALEETIDLDLIGVKSATQFMPVGNNGDDKENDATVAHAIAALLVQKYEFRNDESGLYVYNEATGIFEGLSNKGDYKGSIAFFVTNNAQGYNEKLKSSIFNIVYSRLRNYKKWSRPMPEIDQTKVCLRNVVFDLADGNVMQHDKRFGFKSCIGAYYESHAKLASISKNYFLQLGGGLAGAKLILAALGIVLSNYRKLGKAIFLYGPRNNGKSTLAELIRRLLPEKAVRGLSMSDFGNQFAIANLKNAHVTICTDLPTGAWSKTAIGKFKQTVTGDFFEAGAKGVQQDTIKPHAFVMFIANFLPKIPASQDPEGAVQRRVWPIKTGESVPPEQVDVDLLEKLLDDRDAIVSVALQEASALLHLEMKELNKITSASDEIYNFEPITAEECVFDFVNTLIFTDNESDQIPLSTLFEDLKQRYAVNCGDVKTMKINGFAVYLRKAIKDIGGTVKKLHNVSTLVGFRINES